MITYSGLVVDWYYHVEFFAKLNLFLTLFPSYYNYVSWSHQYHSLATCIPFYFSKFRSGDVEQNGFEI